MARLQILRYPDPRLYTVARPVTERVVPWVAARSIRIRYVQSTSQVSETGKVLASAVANAENNHNLDVDALVVAEASVGKSISMKRFMTRARGRSSRIVKPFSRIRVVVREQEEA